MPQKLPPRSKKINPAGLERPVPLKIGQAPLSPYIIHLSRPGSGHEDVAGNVPTAAEPRPLPPKQNGIDDLRAQLMNDDDLEAATFDTDDDLSIEFEALVEQLRLPSTRVNLTEELATVSRNYETPCVCDVDDLACMSIAIDEIIEEPVLTYRIYIPRAEIERAVGYKAPRKPREWPALPKLHVRHWKAVSAFVLLSFALVLPLQAMQALNGNVRGVQNGLTASAGAAVEHLLSGLNALKANRYDVASENFASAHTQFGTANQNLSDLNLALSAILKSLPNTKDTVNSTQSLITAGENLSAAAATMSNAATELSTKQNDNLVTKLSVLDLYVSTALPALKTAQAEMAKVEPASLPLEYQTQVSDLQARLPAMVAALSEFHDFSETLQSVLGADRQMRYLVAFQNNSELRPTGGFIGSFAEIDVENGKITHINVPPGGTYDLQGQLSAFVKSPVPLSLLNLRWEFQDANYFPDFPTSAEKMTWFYEKAGGPTVDGVIAVNASLVPDLLAVLGAIEMPEYNRTIDAENFLFETQKIVDLEYDQFHSDSNRQEKAPKQFIADLAPKVLDKLEASDPADLLAVLDRVAQGLAEKDIQLYFKNDSLESQVKQLRWAGEIAQTEGDYLMVVDTNLGGGKTDSVIEENVDLQVNISADGTVRNTVTVTRNHRGLKGALFQGLNNVDYLRLYVPRGSKLLSASGFEAPPASAFDKTDLKLRPDEDLVLIQSAHEIDVASDTDIWHEAGKTVFGNWVQTGPGQTVTATFIYELPFKVAAPTADHPWLAAAKSKLGLKNLHTYSLLVEPQSGVAKRTTSVSVTTDDSQQILWSSRPLSAHNEVELNQKTDSYLQILLERHD